MAFFPTVAFYAYFSHHFYGLFYCLIFRDISLKSQELSVLFFITLQWIYSVNLFRWIVSLSHLLFCWFMHLFSRHVSFNIQWKFICLFYFVELSNCIRLFIRIHSDIVSYLFIRLILFELFSHPLFLLFYS